MNWNPLGGFYATICHQFIRMVGGNSPDKVEVVVAGGFGQPFAGPFQGLGGDESGHYSASAEAAGDGPCIDAADAGNVLGQQVLVEGHPAFAVAGKVAMLPDDEAADLDAAGLDVLGVDPVVPDQWIGEGDQLAGVRGVGEDFLVPGHAGVENHLAPGETDGTEGLAPVN